MYEPRVGAPQEELLTLRAELLRLRDEVSELLPAAHSRVQSLVTESARGCSYYSVSRCRYSSFTMLAVQFGCTSVFNDCRVFLVIPRIFVIFCVCIIVSFF